MNTNTSMIDITNMDDMELDAELVRRLLQSRGEDFAAPRWPGEDRYMFAVEVDRLARSIVVRVCGGAPTFGTSARKRYRDAAREVREAVDTFVGFADLRYREIEDMAA